MASAPRVGPGARAGPTANPATAPAGRDAAAAGPRRQTAPAPSGTTATQAPRPQPPASQAGTPTRTTPPATPAARPAAPDAADSSMLPPSRHRPRRSSGSRSSRARSSCDRSTPARASDTTSSARPRRLRSSSLYYRTQLKDKGDLVYDVPPVHMFEVGRFREESMAFPPGVTVKDYTWGGAKGYLVPTPGANRRDTPPSSSSSRSRQPTGSGSDRVGRCRICPAVCPR